MTELLTIIDADGGELAVTEANNLRWEQPIEGAFSTKDKPKHERLMRSRPFRYVGSRMEQAGLKLKFGVMGHDRDTLKDRVEALRWRMDPDRGQFQLKRTLASAEVRQCYVSLSTFDADEKAIAHGGPLVPVTAVVEMSDLWFDPTEVSTDTDVTVNNPGFETFTGTEDDGTSDDFANWTEATDDGNGDKVEATATAHAGSYAVKLTRGTGTQASITSESRAATAGKMMRLAFYTRGDGTYAGRYRIYDVTNSENIVPATSTAITGETYTQVIVYFTVPAGCANINVRFLAPSTDTGVAYFDVVALKTTHVIGCNCVVFNGGFETGTLTDDDGNNDDFDNWTEVNDASNLTEATATVHGGSHALKLTQAAGGQDTRVVSDTSVTIPGETMLLSFWTRGDGTYAGRYGVYDATHAAWIVELVSTGVTGTVYTEVTNSFVVPSGCVALNLVLRAPSDTGGVAYFDDVTLKRTTILISCANSNVPTWINAVLENAVDTPKLENAAGDYLELEDSMIAGDSLEIEFDPIEEDFGAAYTPGAGSGEDWTGKRSTSSKWWELAAGTTNVEVSATSGTCGVTITFKKYYRVPA